MSSTARLAALAAVALLLPGIGASSLSAQETSSIATSEARNFLGAWNVTIQSDFGEFPLKLNIKDADGKLAGDVTVSVDGAGMASPIQRISKNNNNLVLNYTADFQGTPFPITITLSPDGEKLKVTMNGGDGMFTATGTGTKS